MPESAKAAASKVLDEYGFIAGDRRTAIARAMHKYAADVFRLAAKHIMFVLLPSEETKP